MNKAADTLAYIDVDHGRAAPAPGTGQIWRAAPRVLRQISLGALQILGLCAFNAAGATFAGNVVVSRFVRMLTYIEAADVFS